ncbi:hypothetical protein, partial [Flavobacterium aquidurense]|uniref:hypothetical protein n=1 Tax=Flavobacterium aquidurense TaxID=362413 RepID=UPI002865A147
MKKLYYQYLAICYLFLMLLGSAFTANAQVIVPFKERTSSFSPTTKTYHIKGNFTMMGNTNLTLLNYNPTTTNGNNQMKYVDIDGDNTTLNSSSSTLVLPTDSGTNVGCSKVVFAGLYWTGRVSNANNSPNTFSATNGTLTKTLDKRKISFKGPSASGYDSFTATDIYFPTNTNGNMFTAYAEVTKYVQDHGTGEYFAADIAATQGNDGGDIGKYAGWALIVVYENSSMKNRDITIFDGHAYVRESQTLSYTIPVSGFNSVATGAVGIKLGIMAGEGDVNYDGDYFQIQKLNSANYLTLSRTGNTTDNFFNSSIQTGGNARNPLLVNNSGIDISMFDLPNAAKDIIGNGQTSTTFKYGSDTDTYTIFAIAMAVDAYVPEMEATLTATTINNAPAGAAPYTVLPGQELGYKLQLKNRGTEAIQNTKIVIPIPYNATFVPNSLIKTITPGYPAPLPNNLTYEPTVGANGSIVWDYGTLALPSDPNTVLAELTFKLKATENCALLKNSNCSNIIQVNGLMSGTGVTSTVSVSNKPFILGYTTSGSCSGVAISAPLETTINAAAYINANCQATPSIIAFTFCSAGTTIPITDVIGSFPTGSTFYNAYPVVSGTTQYTINNPFPATAGTNTYYAIPPGASSGCYFQFTITIENITTKPTVITPLNYCIGDVAVPLTATPTKPEYTLYYYPTNTSSAQSSFTPPTDVAGQFTYYVAEGKTNSCIGPKTPIVVNVTAKPTVVITTPAPICAPATTLDLRASAITAGSTSGLTYTYWTDAGATASLANPEAAVPGTYYIKGTTPSGCFDIKQVIVTKSTVVITEVIASHVNVLCNGGATGSITINAATGGVAPYTYSWKKGVDAFAGNVTTLTALSSGSYEVTATDANGCSGKLTIEITQPNVLTATPGAQTNVLCNAGTNGSATVNVTGGTGAYTYLWAPTGGTAATASGLAAGTYTVTIKDANLCQTTQSFTITQPAALSVTPSQTNASCNGGANGTATVAVTGGTGAYTYSWSPSGGTAATASGLAAGTYTVTITDANLCQTTQSFTITQPAALSVTPSQTNASCNGGANGTATVAVTGGTGAYTYSWSPSGGTAATASGLAAGTYTVTITDANLCQTTQSFTITQPAALSVTPSQTNASCNGGANGTATVAV